MREMASFEFRADPNAGAEIVRSEGWARWLLAATHETAEAAKLAFEAAGPHPYEQPGHPYRESLTGTVGMSGDGFAGRVLTTSPIGYYLEMGTSDTPTFASIQRGCDAVGLRIEGRNVKRGHV